MGGGRFGIIQAKMMIAWTRAVAVGLEKHGCVYSVFLGCRIGRTRPRRERSQQRQLSDLQQGLWRDGAVYQDGKTWGRDWFEEGEREVMSSVWDKLV